MARGTCLDCVRKHIAQAAILMDEAALGYPHHRWFAAGHLAEAESESRGEYPGLAQFIRVARLGIMTSAREPNFDDLILHVCRVDDPNGRDLRQDPQNSKTFAAVHSHREMADQDEAAEQAEIEAYAVAGGFSH